MEIISNGAVTGHADTHLLSLAQKSGSPLAQLQVSGPSRVPQLRASEPLNEHAHALNSRVLSALAVRIGAVPNVKVNKRIIGLIVRSMQEANEEVEHKGLGDTELSTNEQTHKEKAEAVETLQAEFDQLEASV